MNAFPPAATQPKLIYLARRNAALSRPQFTERWRRHGALGMAQPRWRNIARYVHCDVLHPHSARTKLLADDYDGVGFVWHRSHEARQAHLADTSSRATMERDELETFAEPVVNFCTVTQETALMRPDTRSSGLAKLIRFVRACERAYARDVAPLFVREGAALKARLQAVHAPLCGHVVNQPLPFDGAPGRRDSWGLDVDCIEELWFADAATALRAVEALAEPARQNFDATTVITNEVVLYEV